MNYKLKWHLEPSPDDKSESGSIEDAARQCLDAEVGFGLTSWRKTQGPLSELAVDFPRDTEEDE